MCNLIRSNNTSGAIECGVYRTVNWTSREKVMVGQMGKPVNRLSTSATAANVDFYSSSLSELVKIGVD